MITPEEIVDILQLINSENLGPITFYKLLEKFGTAKAAIENIGQLKKVRLWPREKAVAVFENAARQKIELISYNDGRYPQLLRGLNDAPPLLFVRGNCECLNFSAGISVVGARNASINGRKTASRIAYDLTNKGIMVVSGMARGIDAAAHKGALYAQNQCGATVAVLGTGVDIPYPDENAGLYEQITEQGCIISELLPGSQPQANNFPRRNRIVAALTQGTLVVEATAQSGSLITAQLAADYGRELFAVPGSPTEPRSIGPNRLIKSGAHLVETAEDIVKHIHSISACQQPRRKAPKQKEFDFAAIESPNSAPTNGQTKIIDYLNADGVYVDEIIRASGLDAAQVALELLELEMDGRIERQSGNKVALIKQKSSR